MLIKMWKAKTLQMIATCYEIAKSLSNEMRPIYVNWIKLLCGGQFHLLSCLSSRIVSFCTKRSRLAMSRSEFKLKVLISYLTPSRPFKNKKK